LKGRPKRFSISASGNGFGYDPLFLYPGIRKTFAEVRAGEKAKYSHRGAAFRKFLGWCRAI
jgi:XTP/dITP diphosphohydrolase